MRNFVNLGYENMQDVGGMECKFESGISCFGLLNLKTMRERGDCACT